MKTKIKAGDFVSFKDGSFDGKQFEVEKIVGDDLVFVKISKKGPATPIYAVWLRENIVNLGIRHLNQR